MVGFIIAGGIGDCILSLPVAKKLEERFGEKVVIVCFDKHLIPILSCKGNEVRCEELEVMRSVNVAYGIIRDCSLAVWNRFESDNDGNLNHFYSLDSKNARIPGEMMAKYKENLSSELGRKVGNLETEVMNGIMMKFSNEENYYADWNRYGFDVSYNDVDFSIPASVIEKNKSPVDSLGKYAIVHDSRIFSPLQNIKSWYEDRWEKVVSHLKSRGFSVVCFHNRGEKLLGESLSCYRFMPEDFTFFDFLYLLSRCSVYVGTDSWPAHAAVFIKGPKFILLKGAVSRRWDHFGRYSNIIRKGKCQACEYISLEKCVWQMGKRTCMNGISPEDVIKNL